MNDNELNLLVLQYPLKPAEACMFDNISQAKYKHVLSKLEITTALTLTNQPQAENEYGNGNSSVRHVTHSSSKVTSTVPMVVGVVSDGALHLTSLPPSLGGSASRGGACAAPVSDILQMRPVIVRKEEEYVPVPNNPKENFPPSGAPLLLSAVAEEGLGSEDPQQVLMKRKESEKAHSSKLNSYSHHLATAQAEPFVPLKVHAAGSEQTAAHFEKMYYSGAPRQQR